MNSSGQNEQVTLVEDDTPELPQASSGADFLSQSLPAASSDAIEVASLGHSHSTAPALLSHTSPTIPPQRPAGSGNREAAPALVPIRTSSMSRSRIPVKPLLVKKKKPTKDKSTRQPAASGGRRNGFTQKEVDSLLDLLEEHLPVGRDEWSAVQKEHKGRFPELERNVDSLKRKFAGLYRKTILTGDPHIPPDVKHAKYIRSQMVERIDMGDGDDAEQIADECFDGNDTMPQLLGSDETAELPEPDADFASIAPQTGTPSRTPSLPERIAPSRRPLVLRRHIAAEGKADDDLISIYKMSMLDEQKRRVEENERRTHDREEERSRREEERQRREEERAEEHEQRAEEKKRQERFMDMLMVMAFGRAANGENNRTSQGAGSDTAL